MSGGSDGQAEGSATTVEEACEWCMRAVHESGTSGADGAREVHEIMQWCTRLRSGARARVVHDDERDYGVVHDGTQVEIPMARQWEVPRQLRKFVSGAQEWCTRVVRVEHGSAREVHEITQWCTRLRSGTRVRVVHEMGAREYVVVHE